MEGENNDEEELREIEIETEVREKFLTLYL